MLKTSKADWDNWQQQAEFGNFDGGDDVILLLLHDVRAMMDCIERARRPAEDKLPSGDREP